MPKIVLLAFALCTMHVAFGSLSLSKSPAQAMCLDDTVTIETIDKISFEVEVRYAQLSQTLSNLIKDVGIENPLPLQCSSYTWSLIQCLLPKVLNVTLGIEAQEAQEEIIEMIESWDPQTLLNFLYAVIYLDIPLLQKLAMDEMAQQTQILAIPAELIASIPGDIINPIITRHLINALGPLPIKSMGGCWEGYNGNAPLVITPDRKIIFADFYNKIRIWDSTLGQQLAVCEGSLYVHRRLDGKLVYASLLVTPDSKIVSRTLDTILIWDSATGKQLAELGHSTAVCITPDGRIISGTDDGLICTWSTTGQQLAVCKGHTSSVTALGVLPDGKIVSAARSEGAICIWNSTIDQQLAICEGYADRGIGTLFLTADSKIVSFAYNRLRIWDSTTGKRLALFNLPSHIKVERICVAHQGKIICVVLDTESGKGQIRIWDSTTGRLLADHEHPDDISAFCVLPDDKIASASPSYRRRVSGDDVFMEGIRIWDSTTGKYLLTCNGHTNYVLNLVALPDGKFVSASQDGTVRIWDSRTGQQLAVFKSPWGIVNRLVITPYGKIVSESSGGRLYIWDSAVSLPMNTHQVKKVWLYLQQLIKLRNNDSSSMNIFNKAFWRRVGDKLTSTAARWQKIERILSEDKKDV